MKQWVEQWRSVGPILEAERVERLRALTPAEAGRIAAEIVWPMSRAGAGDGGAGLAPMRDALRRLAAK